MFGFSNSSSNNGTSTTRVQASNYVPSSYIKSRLEHEQQEGSEKNQQKTHESVGASSHWPGPGEVLAPGYTSGPLGYIANPAQTRHSSRQIISTDNDLFYDASSFDQGAGVGLGLQGSQDSWQTREIVTPKLYPDLHGTASNAGAHHRASISSQVTGGQSSFTSYPGQDQGRKGISKEDVFKKSNSSVRFSGVPDSPRQQPATPSVYGTSGSSQFYSNNHLSGSPSLTNLQSGSIGKEAEKVDVLTHRSASVGPSLTSSLGPPIGSGSGSVRTSYNGNGFASQKAANGDIIGSTTRDGAFGTGVSVGAKSSFLVGQDGSVRRQPTGLSGAAALNRDEEEDEKDKERYMPGFLLNSDQGLKGTKVEPFIDSNENNAFRDAYPRQPHQLHGEDAPPTDTLDDLARKERFYSVSRPVQFEAPKTDTRQEASSLAESSVRQNDDYDTIITYGFPSEATSYMLNQFRAFGTVILHRAGTYGSNKDVFDWLMIQYKSAWSAKNAVTRHLKPVGKYYVGVFPYRPTQTAAPDSPSDMDVDVNENELHLSEADALGLQAGVNALMAMRDTIGSDSTTFLSNQTKARQTGDLGASLLGTSRLGLSQQKQQQSLASPFRESSQQLAQGVNEDAVPKTLTTGAGDSGEEDLSSILGHSLTAGGAFARPRRRELPFGSHAKDPLSLSGPISSNGITGNGAGHDLAAKSIFGSSATDSGRPQEAESVGFKPLFGLSESRGLNSFNTGDGQDPSKAQQQQQIQDQRQQELSGTLRLHIRKQFEDGVTTGPIFGTSGSTLFGGAASSSMSEQGSPFGIQKKQRLTRDTFSASAPASSSSKPLSIPVSGQAAASRKSLLVDDPSLADEFGRPKSTPLPGRAGTNNRNATSTAGNNEESMIGSVLSSVKKRLFWG
ncbi:hypothetical protein BGZ94_003377 [Podila epigama]|nr:hypothetical protein BGZ94_003377 [Podila epigama]